MPGVSNIFRRDFFPDLSYTQLYIEYKVPEGGTLEAVQGDIAEIEAYLLSRPDITHVTSSFGGTPSRYNLVRSNCFAGDVVR